MFTQKNFHYLNIFIKQYEPSLTAKNIQNKFNTLTSAGPENVLYLYRLAIDYLKEKISSPKSPLSHEPMELQKSLFAEMEFLLSRFPDDPRHDFIIVIPVAERPRMLENCLQSLVRHCCEFGYGGLATHNDYGMVFRKIRAIIVDDSRNSENIEANRKIANQISLKGIQCRYIGLKEQGHLITKFESKSKNKSSLHRILGTSSSSGKAPAHKGASITRNIAYLSITNELLAEKNSSNTLIWFLDSDEEFSVRMENDLGRFEADIISYFHTLDRLFTENEIDLLTGKVVGDPPVSPAAMVNNLLEDLLFFLKTCSRLNAESQCVFHQAEQYAGGSAQYNDMVHLFGYRRPGKPVAYPCQCSGQHSVSDGFAAFASRINGFFHGLHPTREILFITDKSVDSPIPARTVYTGNYVFRPAMLQYFIPFANLKLRMAGPVLGRVLQSRIGKRFVSANIPLLHKRTIGKKYQSEFRHGVEQTEGGGVVDLSREFVNQFWGDVMLFTIEELIETGFPDQTVKREDLNKILLQTRNNLWSEYKKRRDQITANIDILRNLLENKKHWWNRNENFVHSTSFFRNFICSVEQNFTSNSNGQKILEREITSGIDTAGKLAELAAAIEAYSDDETAWQLKDFVDM